MSRLCLHNTLNNTRQPFIPIDPAHIRMYVCGPTVYGAVHIGNARPAAVFDVLYRLLKRHYPRVTYARNITDIDDKIIEKAAKSGEPAEKVAAYWNRQYQQDMRQLGVLQPDMEPTATSAIDDIIAMIGVLLERGYAYAEQSHVLFHVPAFADYGALSNRRRDEMIAGARVEVAPYKRDAADFVLWKPSTAEQPGWESPWGRGRPGWHIECSAMAAACLGKEIDIHGGGQDLIFPHHENEVAQSRCAHGTEHFARYWLHNGYVRMSGEKMSKSLNNTLLLCDLLKQNTGETVRLALLSTHYRHPLNWHDALLSEARAVLDKWYRVLGSGAMEESVADDGVEAALLDDLNTPAAIARLHHLAQQVQRADSDADAAHWRSALRDSAQLLGLLNHTPQEWFQHSTTAHNAAPAAEEIEKKIKQRQEAKQARDFATADTIRDELAQSGVVLEDTAAGTTWRLAQ